MMNKESKYINVKGQLMDLSEPRVMGILNVTPDSFYSESRLQTVEKIAARVVEIVNEGADFIDIGAYSSRPNADHVSLEEEMNRLRMGLEVITDVCPSIPISVDTFRADAHGCVWKNMAQPSLMYLGRRDGFRDVFYCGRAGCSLHYHAHEGYSANHAAGSAL